jgi:hypothetical protein
MDIMKFSTWIKLKESDELNLDDLDLDFNPQPTNQTKNIQPTIQPKPSPKPTQQPQPKPSPKSIPQPQSTGNIIKLGSQHAQFVKGNIMPSKDLKGSLLILQYQIQPNETLQNLINKKIQAKAILPIDNENIKSGLLGFGNAQKFGELPAELSVFQKENLLSIHLKINIPSWSGNKQLGARWDQMKNKIHAQGQVSKDFQKDIVTVKI